jgi:predicted  nucleic acid-binding Zn-ribbon protein
MERILSEYKNVNHELELLNARIEQRKMHLRFSVTQVHLYKNEFEETMERKKKLTYQLNFPNISE